MHNKTEWIYINNQENSIRYALGTKGLKTLFCFGINPSTATPDKLDPTLKKVEKIAMHNGYDSFIMFNVYPKRDTVFENLEKCIDNNVHIKNIEHINRIMSEYTQIDIWVAFGNHIYDRDYLSVCFKDIFNHLPQNRIQWFATGINKSGTPKHPLYQKKTAKLVEFDMVSFVKTL